MQTKTFERGIHPLYHKELASDKSIEKAALPKRVIIPLSQHIGAPCAPLVKKGDDVTEGQKIGDAKSFVTAPVHASISGKVKDITAHPYPGGGKVMSVIIEGNGEIKDWPVLEDFSIDALKPEDVRTAVREAGIVGLGGAAFPTGVKLSPPEGAKLDAVILNGCECEPYLTADHRLMAERPIEVVTGLKIIMKTVGAKDGFIGIEDNKPECIEAMTKAVAKISPGIKIVLLETKYPQGAEKMLIKAVMGRKVTLGKLPFDAGVIVNNVGTAVAVYEAMRYGKPLIERVVTISGNGIKTPKNLLVRVGTSFEDVIAQCGGMEEGQETLVVNGGPMMGIAQKTLDVPVVKGTSGITVFSGARLKPLEYGPCIRCARCVEACPMALMPYRLGDSGRLGMTDDFKKWLGTACIECGCCAFVCPAQRPLVQWIRVGKVRLRASEKSSSS